MKCIISVLLSGILCLMQLSCSCAEKDEFSNNGLAWLMGLYGYKLSQHLITFSHSNFQPLIVESNGASITLDEILYDGTWMFTSATVVPSISDRIIVPFDADINDCIAGGYQEKLRSDTRSFLEVAQEDDKKLLLVSIYPVEYEHAEYYFLDHRQDEGLQSTLFSGAPVTLQGDTIVVHISVKTTLLSQLTGEILLEESNEYPISIQNLGVKNEKKYYTTYDESPLYELVLTQTELATYVYPEWNDDAVSEEMTYMLVDEFGQKYSCGIPQDSSTYFFHVLPDTLYVDILSAEGRKYNVGFIAFN